MSARSARYEWHDTVSAVTPPTGQTNGEYLEKWLLLGLLSSSGLYCKLVLFVLLQLL